MSMMQCLKKDQIIQMTDQIMHGKLRVDEIIQEYEVYSEPAKINWEVQVSKSPNTYQMYLQSLNPIVFLTKRYELTLDEVYLKQAKEIIVSWMSYKETKPSNPFLWYDHGTALRVENIIYYIQVTSEKTNLIEKEFLDQLHHLIEVHAEHLYNDKNYTKNHNHGIFQDRALIYCAYYLNNENSEKYLEKAKLRLEEQIRFGFNKEMVHVENSPGYQSGVVALVYEIGAFLKQYNDLFGILLMNKIKESNTFLAFIMKPNAVIAEIGDTSSTLKPNESNLGDTFKDEELIYVSTYGKRGIKPTKQVTIYPQAGYYLYRSHWNKEDFKEATWVCFKAGYESKTHKHADDLSFMLYAKGYDIFVDTGWYNYVYGDSFRDYFISSKAHNTVIVDNKSYSATMANAYKTGIVNYDLQNEHYDYVVAFNKMYDNVQIDRSFYYLKDDAILLVDDMASEEVHTYSQLFHLSEQMMLITSSDDEVVFKLKDTPYQVRIKQLLGENTVAIYRGDDKEKYGHISRGMNLIDQIYTVKFDKIGKQSQFLTLITIEDEKGRTLAFDNYVFDDLQKQLTFQKHDGSQYDIAIKTRGHLKIEKVDIKEVQKNTFEFKHIGDINQSLSYAWYIVNEETSKVEHKESYNTGNTFKYTFNHKNNYIIKAYVKSLEGEVEWKIVGRIHYIEDRYQDVTSATSNLQLQMKPHYYEKISSNKYKFTIPYEYFWKIYVVWYVYKNGGYFDTVKGIHTLEYTFKEPGSYTVLYYFRTLNGEEEFWNFTPISIK